MFKAILIGLLFALSSAGATAFAKDKSPAGELTEARWLHRDADLARFLTSTPGECLRDADDPEDAYLVEVGRAAFRSPFLFGGLAARGGLSCDTCHRNGHDNRAFFVEGLSGEPGTADVTSSLFSKVREDNVFNPVKIPSLVDVAGKSSFGTVSPHPSIVAFVQSAVEDEFQGEANNTLFEAIAAYVAHLDSSACPLEPETRSTARSMADVARTLRAAAAAIRRGDGGTADFLIVSAQHELELIHERYAGDGLAKERAALVSLSQRIGDLRHSPQSNAAQRVRKVQSVINALSALETVLQSKENVSLYNPVLLQRFISKGAAEAEK